MRNGNHHGHRVLPIIFGPGVLRYDAPGYLVLLFFRVTTYCTCADLLKGEVVNETKECAEEHFPRRRIRSLLHFSANRVRSRQVV